MPACPCCFDNPMKQMLRKLKFLPMFSNSSRKFIFPFATFFVAFSPSCGKEALTQCPCIFRVTSKRIFTPLFLYARRQIEAVAACPSTTLTSPRPMVFWRTHDSCDFRFRCLEFHTRLSKSQVFLILHQYANFLT